MQPKPKSQHNLLGNQKKNETLYQVAKDPEQAKNIENQRKNFIFSESLIIKTAIQKQKEKKKQWNQVAFVKQRLEL